MIRVVFVARVPKAQAFSSHFCYHPHMNFLKTALLALVVLAPSFGISSAFAQDVCASGFQAIDLENETISEGSSIKGPFFGIPEDDQGYGGTCYSNTAKNLLISVSHGADIPSFLFLALQNKALRYTLRTNDDGGSACFVLEDVKTVGFCPAKLVPLEAGTPNANAQSLIKLGPWDKTSADHMMEDIRAFLIAYDQLKASASPQIVNIAKNMQYVLNQTSTHPEIKFPLPVLRIGIPPLFALKSSYYTNGNGSAEQDDIKLKAFLDDYAQNYQNFYPTYATLVSEGKSLA